MFQASPTFSDRAALRLKCALNCAAPKSRAKWDYGVRGTAVPLPGIFASISHVDFS